MHDSALLFKNFRAQALAEGGDNEYQTHTGIQTADGELRLFIDLPGNRIGLIIPVNEETYNSIRNDIRSSAIQIRKLRGYIGASSQTTLRLTLNDPSLLGVFSVFVDEYLEAIQETDSDAVATAFSMLSRWRRLFKPRSSSNSSYDIQQELGLLCELEVLEKLVKRQGPSALDSWIGPTHSPHDFELKDCSIECKATGSANELRIHIHGPLQLKPIDGKRLDLVVRQYSLDPHGSQSVLNFFERISDLLPGRRDDLVEYITASGCPIFDTATNYEFNKFSPQGCYEFEIVDGFPSIKQLGPETRIKNLRFVIDLSDPHSVAGFRTENRYLDSSGS